MAERLEDSGLNSQQSRAVIEAIANSFEKFAITPERLSAEFERHTESMKKYIDQGFGRVDGQFDLVDKKFDLVDKKFGLVNEKIDLVYGRLDGHDRRFDRLESLIKAMIGWQVAFLTVFIGALVGLVGVLAAGSA